MPGTILIFLLLYILLSFPLFSILNVILLFLNSFLHYYQINKTNLLNAGESKFLKNAPPQNLNDVVCQGLLHIYMMSLRLEA